jgi:hypothetical protein
MRAKQLKLPVRGCLGRWLGNHGHSLAQKSSQVAL